MDVLQALQGFRKGTVERAAVISAFERAGWDESDVGLLLMNTNYDHAPDLAQDFINRRQAQQQRQPNPLRRQT